MAGKQFTLAVNALVRDGEGRCLLLRRSARSKLNPGKWDLPGGKPDPGESFGLALEREIAEETGLAVAIERLAGAVESPLEGRTVVHLIMECRVVGGRLRLSSEHDAFEWVPRRDLGSQDLCPQFRAFLQAFAAGGPRPATDAQP